MRSHDAQGTLDVVLRYTCDICGEVATLENSWVRQDFTFRMAYDYRYDRPPRWRLVDNLWICPKHQISYQIILQGAGKPDEFFVRAGEFTTVLKRDEFFNNKEKA